MQVIISHFKINLRIYLVAHCLNTALKKLNENPEDWSIDDSEKRASSSVLRPDLMALVNEKKGIEGYIFDNKLGMNLTFNFTQTFIEKSELVDKKGILTNNEKYKALKYSVENGIIRVRVCLPNYEYSSVSSFFSIN